MSSQNSGPRHHRSATNDIDPLSAAQIYYGDSHKRKTKTRTYSSVRSVPPVLLEPREQELMRGTDRSSTPKARIMPLRPA